MIGLVPLFPPLYLLAYRFCATLRDLPRYVIVVLAIFAGSQLLAAALSPQPLLSVPIAAVRVSLVLAMVAFGASLRRADQLFPLTWGYLLVFLTAVTFTAWTMAQRPDLSLKDILDNRLSHPIYTQVTLGLFAAVSFWMALANRHLRVTCRLAVMVVSLLILLATGSRGPLLALVVGSGAIVAATSRHRLSRALLAAGILLALLVLSSFVWPQSPFNRLLSLNLTGRDDVWQDAVQAWLTHPLAGVGPLQAGPYLTSLYESRCALTTALELASVTCPSWISNLQGAWLIAHNLVLHSLMETGVVGTAGLLVLLVSYGIISVRRRDPFVLALFSGYMTLNVVDVVSVVPSTHFAELFWVGYGLGVSHSTSFSKPSSSVPPLTPEAGSLE